jgi:membrane fusion protein (multidrug efflux system)
LRIDATDGCLRSYALSALIRAAAKARPMTSMLRVSGTLGWVLLAACRGEAPVAPPPPEVGVVIAQPQSLANIAEVPGRVQAVRTAQVRARVDGIIQKRVYAEGTDVGAGQVLFLIDPREYAANVSAVQASLTRAEATSANAAQDVDRYKGLVEDQAISKQEYDAALARLRTAQADVAQMRAQLESAKLALSYTRVTAPIDGRAGRAQVTEGALVSAANATLLTTIEQLDPVYVNFSQSSSYLLGIRREIAEGTLTVPELGRVEVTLILEDGSTYQHKGHLDFLDLAIDEATGTASARAEVANPDRVLLPGQFVRARIEVGVRPNTFMLPQRAVQLSANATSVFVVNDKNMIEVRPVKTGALRGDEWVVLEGLKAGDRVVVDGVQRIQPGAPVRVAPAAQAAPGKPAAHPAEPPAAEH